MILYRPVDFEELCLTYQAGMRAFPPARPNRSSLPPLGSEPEATDIARRLSTETDGQAGFVTRFSIANDQAGEVEQVEPEGPIQVVRAFFGDGYVGHVPGGGFAGQTATQQFLTFMAGVGDSGFYIASNLPQNGLSVFVNYLYWEQHDFSPQRISAAQRDRVLGDLKVVWAAGRSRSAPLGVVR
jgi:hypothetical protein